MEQKSENKQQSEVRNSICQHTTYKVTNLLARDKFDHLVLKKQHPSHRMGYKCEQLLSTKRDLHG